MPSPPPIPDDGLRDLSSVPPPPAVASAPASLQQSQSRPLKSPPLAFMRTSNDSLIPPLISPSLAASSSSNRHSPTIRPTMGRTSREALLEATVEQQAHATTRLHMAFQAERDAWLLERRGLYERIANLEALLMSGKHDSPAKSPTSSPSDNNNHLTISPQARPVTATKILPTITEDDNLLPSLSARREAAPRSIDLSFVNGGERRRSVSFSGENGLQVSEISPRQHPARHGLSPPLPPNNVMLAGHTPTRVPRPPTPPPRNMSFDGIDDTPTRHNTHLNNFLTQSNDSDDELKGPLNLPALPNQPDEASTFTVDALTKRLEQVSRDPEEAKPTIYQHPSPGMVSPMDELIVSLSRDLSPGNLSNPPAPLATRVSGRQSDSSSKALSPNAAPAAGILSPQDQHDAVHAQFEQGGIKLKKRPSVNFGIPLGSLGGLATRRLS